MHFIADARRFQQHQRGLFFENDASESAYHVGLLRYGLSIWRYHKKGWIDIQPDLRLS
jgi:hypothetical protein